LPARASPRSQGEWIDADAEVTVIADEGIGEVVARSER
jgi:hypothetical protein